VRYALQLIRRLFEALLFGVVEAFVLLLMILVVIVPLIAGLWLIGWWVE
jgi:hypothetical protein